MFKTILWYSIKSFLKIYQNHTSNFAIVKTLKQGVCQVREIREIREKSGKSISLKNGSGKSGKSAVNWEKSGKSQGNHIIIMYAYFCYKVQWTVVTSYSPSQQNSPAAGYIMHLHCCGWMDGWIRWMYWYFYFVIHIKCYLAIMKGLV